MTSAEASERELVARFVAGREEHAFRELYRRLTPCLYQLALRLRGWVEGEAEDVVQETWLRASRRLDRFRFDASLRTWLTGIAINVSRELDRRRASRIAPVPLGDDIDALGAGDDGALRLDLEGAIATLPAGYRQVLVLHDVEGYTHAEIAVLLGIDPGTSKSQLAHARRRLRRCFVAATTSERTTS